MFERIYCKKHDIVMYVLPDGDKECLLCEHKKLKDKRRLAAKPLSIWQRILALFKRKLGNSQSGRGEFSGLYGKIK